MDSEQLKFNIEISIIKYGSLIKECEDNFFECGNSEMERIERTKIYIYKDFINTLKNLC